MQAVAELLLRYPLKSARRRSPGLPVARQLDDRQQVWRLRPDVAAARADDSRGFESPGGDVERRERSRSVSAITLSHVSQRVLPQGRPQCRRDVEARAATGKTPGGARPSTVAAGGQSGVQGAAGTAVDDGRVSRSG